MKKSLSVLFGTLLIVGYTVTNTIHIDERNGRNSFDCIKAQSPCQTLQYTLNKAGNNSLVVLDSTVVTITGSIQVYHRENITIVGKNSTTIRCTCTNHTNVGFGLVFVQSSNIILRDVQVDQCSLNITVTKANGDTLLFNAGIFFRSCINVTIDRVTVSNSIGFGLFLLNCFDEVTLRWSNFINNSIIDCDNNFGGGGALVLIDSIIPLSDTKDIVIEDNHNSTYLIVQSNFIGNHRNTHGSILHDYHLLYGGGLNIVLSHNATGQVFTISDCQFANNTSVAGGGVAVSVRKGACNNTLKFDNCDFVGNNGGINHVGGGGGMTIALYYSKKPGNHLNISQCRFMNNTARYGGGVALAAGHSHEVEINIVYFEKCSWANNSASLSAAVDISPQVIFQDELSFNTAVHFSGCDVVKNVITPHIENGTNFKGRGAFLVARLRVSFSGKMFFDSNNATALYLDLTYIHISKDSLIEIIGNNGELGGAVMMRGYSGLRYDNNVTFTFTNNTSKFSGGAICNQNTDQHLTFHSHMCIFMPNKKVSNVNFKFVNNRAATDYGQSIFMTCINPCKKFCSEKNNIPISNLDNPFAEPKCFGNLTFSENNTISTDINTLVVNNMTNGSAEFLLTAIPGKSIKIPLETQDDFGRKTTSITAFYVRLLNATQKYTRIDVGSNIINNDQITIHGQPGTNGTIMFSAMIEHGVYVTLKFTLLQCPPGSVIMNHGACECSATTNSTYYGITGCKNLSGLLLPGYWVGYISDNVSEDSLYTGNCPRTYCDPINNNKVNSVYQGRFLMLTSEASKRDLEKLICAKNRQGTLCGHCTNDTSVFYHSDVLSCESNNKYCKFSWIFYILSDLVPITVLFGILLVLNVSLTSGSAYSIIMMMQLMHYLQISARGAIAYEQTQHRMISMAIVFYDFSNLKFLSIEPLSFCLWPSAQTLDIMVMKYASVLFSMLLVKLFVLLMNKCSCSCIKKLCRRNSESQYSMVEGLTAFLVLCYTQTTSVTFEILNRGTIYGKGHHPIHVAFLDGETKYLEGVHLKYAIPALLFLIVIVIPTPLLLICDPCLLKLEDRFCQKQNPWSKLRIRFKPLCDSFQNCFRNKMKFSAGFYFLYRVILLSFFSFTSSMFQFLYWTQIVLIILVTFHSILQPFELKKDNIIGSICFCYMALVNGLTLILYNSVTNDGYSMAITVIQWIQVAFLYLPILFGISWAVKYITVWFGVKAKQKFLTKKLNEVENVGELFERTTSNSFSYQTIQN